MTERECGDDCRAEDIALRPEDVCEHERELAALFKSETPNYHALCHMYAAREAEAGRLRQALTEVWPRYVELFEAAGLGNAEADSVAAPLVRAALAAGAPEGQAPPQATSPQP